MVQKHGTQLNMMPAGWITERVLKENFSNLLARIDYEQRSILKKLG